MAGPEGVEAAPFFQQVTTGAILGIGALGMMAWRFITGQRKAAEPAASRVVVEQGTVADYKPVLDPLMRIMAAVESTSLDTHEMLKLARQEAEDDQVERKAEEIAERKLARERAAYEDKVYDDMARRLARLPKDGS